MVLLREQQPQHRPPRRINNFLGMVFVLLAAVAAIVFLARNVRLTGSGTVNTNSARGNTNAVLSNATLEVIIPKIADEIRGKLAKGDFAVLVSPSLRSLKPGGKTSYTIQTIRAEGAPTDLALEITGLPESATSSLSTSTLSGESATSVATVTVPSTVSLGKYEIAVLAKGTDRARSASAVLTVSDLAATNVVAGNVAIMSTGTKWQALVTWQTDAAANTWVEYAAEQRFIVNNQSYEFTANDTGNETGHSVTLSYLEPATTYHYRIRSVDKLGNTVVSDDQMFVTQ